MKIFERFRQATLNAVIRWAEAGRRLTSYRGRRRFHWLPNIFISVGLLFIIADYFKHSAVVSSLSNAEGRAAYEFWIGTKSVLDIALGLVTTLIALTAAYLALRSYRVNQRAAVANRYQKGVELLGASADSSKLGGIELLSIVAREAPEEYQEPVMRTLRQFLHERCASITEPMQNALNYPEMLPATDFVVMAALSAVSRTLLRQRWLDLEADEEGLTLRGIYLHKVRILKADFSRITFEDGVFGDVSFEGCKFAETAIIARFFGRVAFEDCSIDNAQILATDVYGEQFEDAKTFIDLSKNSWVSRFDVNNQRIET
ncbi:hypothetical protein J2045_003514 [Peteryoungia aggregata LMG 23059]|uniref:Pentapeptide repeat-containing protein n=1 Tax=Peteryoungia aggregata LMG 23059 TaxID=1368425 RepID=A0ABU0GCJ9_9HYPH|nr:hypothetical protein [Peteryoungia aggregata]MDQ0422466.1 hypothetical protein [Peteryoungia aggregata LMG 23059]